MRLATTNLPIVFGLPCWSGSPRATHRLRLGLRFRLGARTAVSANFPGAILTVLFGGLLLASTVHAQRAESLTNSVPGRAEFLAYAQDYFNKAQTRYATNRHDPEAGWQMAKAYFEVGEYATNSTQRAELAEKGIALSRLLVARNTNLAPAHYFLAMNLGQMARTKGVGALKLVAEMEREFITARTLDEHFDYAGPDRNLGNLYRDAPVIGSVGSRSKARRHLQRAAELEPGFPDNKLTLIESYLKWNDRRDAQREWKALETIWQQAHSMFTGAAWASCWDDWEKRLKTIKKRLEEYAKQTGTYAP